MRPRAAVAAVAVFGLSWAVVGGPSAPPAAAQQAEGESSPVEAGETVATEQAVVGDGHVDIGPRFLDGEWSLMVRDDTVEPSAWRHLTDVVLQATDQAVVEVPDDPEFAFLGEPGARVWLLPQVQQPGILWPGWNTQDPEVAAAADREVTWTLHGVEGPGAVVLFVNQEFGTPETLFDSREPVPQETGIEVNTHAHANWVFTEPGVYRLAMAMSATTTDGEQVSGGGTLRVAVGDATDPEEAFTAAELAVPEADADAAGEGTGSDGSEPPAGGAGDGGSGSAAAWVVTGAAVAVLVLAAAIALLVQARRRRARTGSAVGTAGDAGGTGDARGPAETAPDDPAPDDLAPDDPAPGGAATGPGGEP
jgi:putative ABC transporter-associated repeat protein